MKNRPKPLPRRDRTRQRVRLPRTTSVAELLDWYDYAEESKRHAERRQIVPVRG